MIALALVACTGDAAPGLVGDVELVLVQPYAEDPLTGADTSRIVVRDASGAEVASGEAALPAFPALTGIEALGVVDVEVAALAGGTVIAAGRTGPVALGAGESRAIELLFLPVNEGVTLDHVLDLPRRAPTSARLADGTVLVLGGRNGTSVLDDAVLWHPIEGFGDASLRVDGGLDLPITTFGSTGFIAAGGRSSTVGAEEAGVVAFDALGREIAGIPDMPNPRAGHCLAPLAGQAAFAVGGRGDGDKRVDILRPAGGSWNWSGFVFQPSFEGDFGTIGGCAATRSGYVVAVDAESTTWHVFDLREASITSIDDRYATANVIPARLGPIVVPYEEDAVLVIGGHSGSSARGDSVVVDARAATDAPGPVELEHPRANAHARWWNSDHRLAIGPGTGDAFEPVDVLEIVDVETGEAVVAPIDVAADDSAMEVLPGGAIVFLGGEHDGVVAVMPY